jgi:hypothetical protein
MPKFRLDFANWHHPQCGGELDCQIMVCRLHRRKYWACQALIYERETHYFGGNPECIECNSDARRDWVLRPDQRIA